MIRICFRLDDPSATSNHNLEQRLLAVFSKHSIPLCAAVVPFKRKENETVSVRPDNVRHLVDAQRAGLLEVALHGHSHIPRGKMVGKRESEFAGLGFEEQLRLIDDAKHCLLDTFELPIFGFVPPWNTFDHNTVEAVSESGFTYLSAGVRDYSFRANELAALPKTALLNHLSHDMIQSLQRFMFLSPLIVVVFHQFDIKESGSSEARISLSELDRLLAWLNDDPSIVPVHMKQVVKLKPSASAFWRPDDLFRRLPARLTAWLPQGAVFPRGFRKSYESEY